MYAVAVLLSLSRIMWTLVVKGLSAVFIITVLVPNTISNIDCTAPIEIRLRVIRSQ